MQSSVCIINIVFFYFNFNSLNPTSDKERTAGLTLFIYILNIVFLFFYVFFKYNAILCEQI